MARKKQSNINAGESAILKKRSPRENILFAIVFVIFVIYAASLIYPFLYMMMNSFLSLIHI